MFSLRLVVHSLTRASRFRLLQTRPPGRATIRAVDETSTVRTAPARVLLVGAGVLAGYGVADHADAVAGPLAARLAESLQRDVVVHCRVAPLLPMKDALHFIGPNGSHTFDAVVFAPCFLEGQFAPTALTGRHLGQVVRHLESTGRPDLGLVLLTLPEPTRSTRLDRAVADAARRQAALMQDLATDHASTSTVDAPSFNSVSDRRPFDAAYYEQAADVVAAALTSLLSPVHAETVD